jgi:mRNA interferase MazF
MNETGEFRRGDIVLTVFPYITDPSKSKERPAVIIQNDIGNRYGSNLIVAAISSQIPRREYPFHFCVPLGSSQAEGTGLQKNSIVHTEIILTIPKASARRRIGRFNNGAMKAIDECLRISLALK